MHCILFTGMNNHCSGGSCGCLLLFPEIQGHCASRYVCVLSNESVRRRNRPNNFIRPSNCHLILEGFFRQKQTISDDLQNAVCLLPALKNKALTISDELRPNTKFRTPKRQAVGSNPAGCAEDPSGATKR